MLAGLRLRVRREGLGIDEDVLMIDGVDAIGAPRDNKAASPAAAIIVLPARQSGRAENTESDRRDHRGLSKLQHCRISKLYVALA